MTGRVQDKSIFLTAAGQGMGREAAILLSCEGADVFATDIRDDLLETLSDEAVKRGGRPIKTAKLDVTDGAAIKAMIEPLPALDVLFNCAGFVHQGTIFETTDDDWDFSFNVNVRSMFHTIQAALPKMLANGGGSIINMASVCGAHKGLPNRLLYGASKAAVVGLTKAIAADYVTNGVRCNCICPGTVETPSLGDRMRDLGDIDEARKMFTARQPMGRIAQAAEIIPIIIYLASEESAFSSGQQFNVDGGMTI